ncbi:MAG: hypothetical protein BRD23_08540, partial [Halobacteriales archaeon SW_9_67_25]
AAFTLLLVTEAGALAGFVAGYYRSRALVDKRRAERFAEGLAMVNDVLRHDLRNDLQVVEGRADLLATADSPAAVADHAETIRGRAREARDRLGDTEAIAETLNGTATFGTVVLAAVVRDVIEHSGRTPHVKVGVEAEGEVVCLTVRDDGPGLPEEAAAFLAGDRKEGPDGGLRIVRRLVTAYGGDIAVETAEGTTVTVELSSSEG